MTIALPRRLQVLVHSLESLSAALVEDSEPLFDLKSLGIGTRLGELLFESTFIVHELGFGVYAQQLEAARQRLDREVFVEASAERTQALAEIVPQLAAVRDRFR